MKKHLNVIRALIAVTALTAGTIFAVHPASAGAFSGGPRGYTTSGPLSGGPR